MAKRIEKQRNMSINGRDDPSNIVGNQKGFPGTMRHGSNQQRRQLDPLKDRKVVLSASKGERLNKTLNNNIQGMLSDLNRAKNMRIANQVLKE